MRHPVWWLSAVVFLSSACGGIPPHKIERLRFSDSRSVASLLAHSDTFDCRFEMSEVQYVHAHIDVTHPSSWFTKTVPVTCNVKGPKLSELQSVQRDETLPRQTTSTTWALPLRADAVTKWVDGQYQVRCETATASIQGEFEIVDTTAALFPRLGSTSRRSKSCSAVVPRAIPCRGCRELCQTFHPRRLRPGAGIPSTITSGPPFQSRRCHPLRPLPLRPLRSRRPASIRSS